MAKPLKCGPGSREQRTGVSVILRYLPGLFLISFYYFHLWQDYDWSEEFVIADWELTTSFDPLKACEQLRTKPRWVTLDGTHPKLSADWPTAVEVLSGKRRPGDPNSFPIRDPEFFVAGGLSMCSSSWEELLSEFQEADEIIHWIKQGVDITQYFKRFQGSFRGKSYNSAHPPRFYQKNSKSCQAQPNLVARTLEERIRNGSLQVLGKVKDLSLEQLPICIMPLTLDKSKFRLCHDERFLNLFIRDLPFKLDTLREVPRLVGKYDLLVNTDEKSGYDHVLLATDSQRFFGVAFGGWIMVYRTLPFGFKAACYIYQRLGLCTSVFLRKFGIPALQYIDDRLFNVSKGQDILDANGKLYAILHLLTSLGYTLSVEKSTLVPTTGLRFLGFIVDTKEVAFKLPDDKKVSFKTLRDSALSGEDIDILTLQKLAGKCSSFAICIPGALFYIRELNRAISQAQKTGKSVPLTGSLREEIEHWCFIDNWEGVATWRKETHSQITIATDASSYKWAGKVMTGEAVGLEVHDYFTDLAEPIHVKEAQAVLKTLQALQDSLKDCRVDLLTDNQALIAAWQRQGSKSKTLNDILKSLFSITIRLNLDLQMQYINTSINPADAPSRTLSSRDAMLSESCWQEIESNFGPHTCDLMALDSNAMSGVTGVLRHFTPYPTPGSAGVNVFAQKVEEELNPYVFPPFSMIPSLLKFLKERKVKQCTMVIPVEDFRPTWWPHVIWHSTTQITLGLKGEKHKLKYPSRQGWILDNLGLPFSLAAVRLGF